MRKSAVYAAVALVGVCTAGSADAQRRYPHGVYGGGWGYPYYGYRRSGGYGGAVAAGLIGGLVLGGIAAAASTPAYAYPAYPYGGYYPAPSYGARYVYAPGPFYNPPVMYGADPYAAPHEIQGGYRTIYVPGQNRRVIPGGYPY